MGGATPLQTIKLKGEGGHCEALIFNSCRHRGCNRVWLTWKKKSTSLIGFPDCTFTLSQLNIKIGWGTKKKKCRAHISERRLREFGAAENFVIGKINNIYSGEMQISLRWGAMNNWVRTITLNNSFLNILQCVVLWPEEKGSTREGLEGGGGQSWLFCDSGNARW